MRRIALCPRACTHVIIALAVLARFIPHLPDFSPVYGALLFGGAHLSKRESIASPLILLGASDFILTRFVYQMHFGWLELVQLAAFAAIVAVGWSLRRGVTIARLTIACLSGPTAFYLVSNFGVWLGWHAYARSWEGLIACYVAAIPFYGYSVASTFVFGGALFGIDEFLAARRQDDQPAEAPTS
jgi:hypothetical protein